MLVSMGAYIWGSSHSKFYGMPNYPQLYLYMHVIDIILHIHKRIIMTKAHVKFQSDWLKIFQEKVKKF